MENKSLDNDKPKQEKCPVRGVQHPRDKPANALLAQGRKPGSPRASRRRKPS